MSWKEHNAEDYITQLFSYVVFDDYIDETWKGNTVYLLTF